MQKAIVIIDPTKDKQPALSRAIDCAQFYQQALHIRGIINGHEKTNKRTLPDHSQAEKSMRYYAEKVRDKNIEVVFSLASNDQKSNNPAIVKSYSDYSVVFKDYHAAPWRETIQHNDVRWMLDCKSHVCIVKGVHRWKDLRILVDMENSSDEKFHDKLFMNELTAAKYAEKLGADVYYLVNYKDSLHYPDRSQLLKQFHIDNRKIIIRSRNHAKILCEVAKEVNSKMIISGAPKSSDSAHYQYEHFMHNVMKDTDNDLLLIH